MANSSNDPQYDTDGNEGPTIGNPTPTNLAPTNSGSVNFSNQSWNPFSKSLTSSPTIKLDRINFLAWKSQVAPTVIGHNFDDLLFSKDKPPQFLINGDPNPAYSQ